MRLRHIELFQAILQTGSLTAAAELLHISQPAASKILKHAEQQLGFALFDRVRGKLQPTAEARVLQQQTERLAIDLQNLRRLADSLGRGEECALRLICTPALAQALLPQALRTSTVYAKDQDTWKYRGPINRKSTNKNMTYARGSVE